MRSLFWPRRLRVALGACLAGAFLWVLLSLPIPLLSAQRDTTSSGVGEALLNGINPEVVSYHLPMSTLLEDFLLNHAPPAAYKLVLAAVGAGAIVLIAALTGLLAGTAGAWASAGLIFFALAWALGRQDLAFDYVGWNVQLIYALLFLILAGLMVRRAQKPTTANALALALAIGASLLCRSPLAFFPPLLAAVEFLGSRRDSKGGRWKSAVILCGVPYLFLLPWIHMNWVIHRQFIPFEYKEADCNIVTGALGLVPTIEGDWRSLVDNPPDSGKPGAVLRWAFWEVLRHPVRTVGAYLERLAFVVSLQPILFMAGALALWLHRRRREFRRLALLAAYFIAIHCFMSVEEKYFVPVWLLFMVLGATLMAKATRRIFADFDERPVRGAGGVFAAGLSAALLVCAVTARTVLAYAELARVRAPESEEALAGAIASSGGDPWLLAQRGERRLRAADLAGAAGDFSRALALQPDNAQWHLNLAWALALQGRPEPLLKFRFTTANYDGLTVRVRLLKAIGYLSAGRLGEAEEQLRLARENQIYGNITVRRVKTELERRSLEKLRAAGAKEFSELLAEFCSYCPPAMRWTVESELARLLAKPDSDVLTRSAAR